MLNNRRDSRRRDAAAGRAGYRGWADFLRRLKGTVTCEEVATRWCGAKLQPAGSGWMILCPFHAEKTPSCHLDGWVFHCFGTGCRASGDAIEFTRRLAGTGFIDTVLMLAGEFGLPVPELPVSATDRPAASRKETESDVRPKGRAETGPTGWPPALPPEEPDLGSGELMVWFRRSGFVRHRPDMWHEYRDTGGRLVALTARTQKAGGTGKVVLPVTWRVNPATGKGCWTCRGHGDAGAPIYGRERLGRFAGGETAVLLVDGEKTCDAADRLLGRDWAALSVMGGCGSAHRADWSDVAELIRRQDRRTVIAVWPDADRPQGPNDGNPALEAADRLLTALGLACSDLRGIADCRVVVPPADLPHGWGLDDAEAAGRVAGWATAQLAEAIAWTGPGSLRGRG